MTFLGKPMEYWVELQARFEAGDKDGRQSELLDEIIFLKGRVAFYESRIKEMSRFIKGDNE